MSFYAYEFEKIGLPSGPRMIDKVVTTLKVETQVEKGVVQRRPIHQRNGAMPSDPLPEVKKPSKNPNIVK